MPGKWITEYQKRIYMEQKNKGDNQELAAAKAGFSIRTAKRIDSKKHFSKKDYKQTNNPRDPFQGVWENELVPLLEKNPKLQAVTLLRHLQESYKGKYPDKFLRTLQRRIQRWRAIYGPEKEIIFRQNHPPGWQCLSDFTHADELNVRIDGIKFSHLLYHFWLPFSKWEYAFVITGGESFTALAEGLQGALWALGGVPQTHRTDSLSAAYKNLSKAAQDDFTNAYEEFCKHYSMEATRNNKGVKHENGSVEVSHHHLKTRLDQALMIRESRDFSSLEEYRDFVNEQVAKHNARIQHLVKEEKEFLKPLPMFKTRDFDVEFVGVPTTSIITIRQVRYSVPSRLIGMKLKAHVYDDHIDCFLGSEKVISLKRLRWKGGTTRPHSINYRHLIQALSRKPQAFRNYRFRDDLFPTFAFKMAWEHLDGQLDDRSACKEYVALLKLAAEHGEKLISELLEQVISQKILPKASEIESLFPTNKPSSDVKVTVKHGDLNSYNQFLTLKPGETNEYGKSQCYIAINAQAVTPTYF
jgi:hypothetical protein